MLLRAGRAGPARRAAFAPLARPLLAGQRVSRRRLGANLPPHLREAREGGKLLSLHAAADAAESSTPEEPQDPAEATTQQQPLSSQGEEGEDWLPDPNKVFPRMKEKDPHK